MKIVLGSFGRYVYGVACNVTIVLSFFRYVMRTLPFSQIPDIWYVDTVEIFHLLGISCSKSVQ